MSLYSSSVPQFQKMLRLLETWLDKAEAHAAAKKYDPAILLQARLAPDMFPLIRQIQAACDAAKGAAAHLAGREPPKHPDTETTLPEIRERVKTVLAYLDTVTEKDFEGAADRRVGLGFLPGKVIVGQEYLIELALPNFYFHVTMTYAILRHNGIDLGKRDFIGGLRLIDA
ncbi:MAG: DUF1993 domain-containing protein [Polyangiales bacterium]